MRKTFEVNYFLKRLLRTAVVSCGTLALGSTACVATAWAASNSWGEGGSITIDAIDPNTGLAIPDHLVRPGTKILLRVRAYDAQGNRTQCTPTFAPEQGVAGQQIDPNVQAHPEGAIITMGRSFGSAQVNVSCPELPNVKAKFPVVNQTLMARVPPTRALKKPVAPAPTAAAEAAAASAEEDTALILLGSLALVGGGALLIGAAASGSSEEDCSKRTCIKGFSGCSCSGSSNTTCDDGLPVEGSGTTCVNTSNTRVAWCSPGLTCTNAVCGTSCP